MAEINFDQTSFTRGELDPRIQGRTDWEQYYKGAKQIRNALVIPQGGVQSRFGTTYVDLVRGNPIPQNAELATLLYDDITTYLLVWTAANLDIYLENIRVANIATPYVAEDMQLLRFSQAEEDLLICNGFVQPQRLRRSADANNAITAINGGNPNTLTITNAYPVGIVLPAEFNTAGALPTTSPQIFAGRTYFIKAITATHVAIYATSSDAINGVNAFAITALGAASNLQTQNTWAIANAPIEVFPTFDFGFVYRGAAVTFTPSAVSGTFALPVTITAANATPFTAAMVGGLYIGNGGIVRITVFTDNQHVNGYTIEPFPNTNPIPGSQSFIGEPAWSNARGWPRTVSFFQNRLVYAGSISIPNGVWLSAIDAASNFDDSQTLANDAISWYPSSNQITYIRAITSCRSLLFHTSTGTYSSPVSSEIPLTPSNFTLIEQNKFGVSIIQPVFIDNQILYTDYSNNNVINMIWEITQSSYVTNNKSVPSSVLINHPVDMAALATPDFTDGFYVLFVNTDGTVAVLQTLHEENVAAFTLQNTISYQSNGVTSNNTPGLFYRVTNGNDRCWFTVQRQMPTALAPVAITGATIGNPGLITAPGHGLVVGVPTMITFTGAPLVTTQPPISTTAYFWALAVDANNFGIFASQTDASVPQNEFNVIAFNGAGSNVVVWTLTPQLFVEELDFTVDMDSTTKFNLAVPSNTLTGLGHLNGEYVQVVANGFVLNNNVVVNGQITLENGFLATTATVGLQFVASLTTLPVTLPQTFGLLYRPKHIRNMYLQVYNTLGITVQGITVPELQIQNIVFNQVPIPQTGVFEVPLMEGWNSFQYDIVISQPLPLPMTILAVSYRLEV